MALIVALTGGLATGKSFVGAIFEELGAFRIDADRVGHEVLLPGGAAYEAAVAAFGSSILDHGGNIDRRALAAIVFSDPAKLAALNAIVHPAVEQLRLERARFVAAQNPRAIIVCEAAIYIETGGLDRFDQVVLTVCGRELQMERAMERNGWSRQETEARLARQWPDEEKCKFANFVIDTSKTLNETRRQSVEVYNQFRAL